ncbi:MAG TPA: LuxR C-terminal-related transcriptional regulator [Vampirovibrionales bacterium]
MYQVSGMMANGKTARQIASELHLSVATIDKSLRSAYKRVPASMARLSEDTLYNFGIRLPEEAESIRDFCYSQKIHSNLSSFKSDINPSRIIVL